MIIFSKTTLREALSGLRVLKLSKQSLPVLRHVLVIGYETHVEIEGTDLDQVLRYEGVGESTTATRLLVPYDLLDTASKTADNQGAITLTGGDAPSIIYVVSGSVVTVPFALMSITDYPVKPSAEGESIALPAGVLGSMAEALACASTDETRYILNSVYLDAHVVVATDGRQLYRRNSLELPVKEGSIFPRSAVLGILPDETADLWLWHNHDHPYAQIAVGAWRWVTKLIEGNFPNYQQVIPKLENYGGLVRISEPDATRIISVIPKLPGFKDKDSRVILSVTNKGAVLRTAPGVPQVHLGLDRSEVVRTAFTDVAFNSRFFLSALQRGMRELHARDHVSPLVMTDTANRLHVWMPLRDVVTPPEPVSETASSDPAGESPSPVVAPASETNVSETVTHNTDTTMVASASKPPVSETREGVKPAVAPSRINAPEAPANAGDVLQEKINRVRELLKEVQGELGSLQGLFREAGRQYKVLERDHEALKKNIRALRTVEV